MVAGRLSGAGDHDCGDGGQFAWRCPTRFSRSEVAATIGLVAMARFNLELLRSDIHRGRRKLRITTHAQMEAFKDGLLLADLRYVFEYGKVIELYPDDNRGLLYAIIPEYGTPTHVVIEDTQDEGVIITAYVPDRRKWTANKHRRR